MGRKELSVWDLLAKKLIFEQIGPLGGLDILTLAAGMEQRRIILPGTTV